MNGTLRSIKGDRFLAVVPVLVALSACAIPRYTEFDDPTVPVEVRYPPDVGFAVEEVAIAPPDRSLLSVASAACDDGTGVDEPETEATE